MPPKLDPIIVAKAKLVTAKRARTVIDIILEKGEVTMEEIAALGYTHAARAARDVREAGIPLKTTRAAASNGRKMAVYTFGSAADIEDHKLEGRRTFSKDLHRTLYAANGGKCDLCSTSYERRYLTIDHRIPYEIGGEPDEEEAGAFMLLCGECQRKKSWSCEHCDNRPDKDETVCGGCYWAFPQAYTHAALRQLRRVELVFDGDSEIKAYEELAALAEASGMTPAGYLKRLARKPEG